jgi:hypothetical protein
MFTAGYSFGDQHLNEIIFDAAVRRPRSEVIAFFFSDIPEEVGRRALEIPNLTALGAQQVVIGGQELDWAAPPAEIPSVWEGDRFRLGDFRELTRLLTRASAKTSGGE